MLLENADTSQYWSARVGYEFTGSGFAQTNQVAYAVNKSE